MDAQAEVSVTIIITYGIGILKEFLARTRTHNDIIHIYSYIATC